MATTTYNYAIVGAGAAGLQLALAMIDDPYFQDKQVLILEKDQKNTNDRTWSFWEKGDTKWDQLIIKKWKLGQFNSSTDRIPLKLDPYQYKTLRALDFYQFAKNKIASVANFTWVSEEVKNIQNAETPLIQTVQNNYSANHVFDSRIDSAFFEKDDPYFRLLQHFLGWYIETPNPVFDPDRFVMMDYVLKWKDTTSFIYVLPFSPTKAVVEFTFFSPELVNDSVYTEQIKKHLASIPNLKEYQITEVEQGVIPMSNYPFTKHHSTHITKIGTAGGWVKPSTGYSFKNAERLSQKLIQNIKKGVAPPKGIAVGRHRQYDTWFLDVLTNKNEMGESLFSSMYRKNSIQQMFKFLDEETTFPEEIKIMSTFKPMPFLKAIANQFVTNFGSKINTL